MLTLYILIKFHRIMRLIYWLLDTKSSVLNHSGRFVSDGIQVKDCHKTGLFRIKRRQALGGSWRLDSK